MNTNTIVKYDLVIILIFQIILVILYGLLSDYDGAADASIKNPKTREMDVSYSMFQDIHVMIFIGFGFLMTFLKRYGYSAVGFNLLLAALMIQWAVVCRGLFLSHGAKIKISLKALMGADIASASVLISMGALLGQTTFFQLIVMGIVEIAIFSANEYLLLDILKVSDVGGSMVVHAFGAYFGLAVSFVLRPKKGETTTSELEGASYNSDLFAMIGTIFLWLFWPSFNGGLVSGDEQYRAVINTYISLAACTVAAFVVSALTCPDKKFDMVHVQNSTLAGGVAVGSVCNLMLHPFGAIVAGTLAGTLSVIGYKYFTPRLANNPSIRLHDTCGVHNLHGMPGIFSGLISVLLAYLASESSYQQSLYTIFPAMSNEPHMHSHMNSTHISSEPYGRSSSLQAAYQLLGLVATLLIAIVSGIITGQIISSPYGGFVDPEEHFFKDDFFWSVPAESDDIFVITNFTTRQFVLSDINRLNFTSGRLLKMPLVGILPASLHFDDSFSWEVPHEEDKPISEKIDKNGTKSSELHDIGHTNTSYYPEIVVNNE